MPGFQLPADLERLYGRLGFADRVIYSNFVESLDGVATLGSNPSAGSLLSGRNPADRFLMGLLRACADAVLLGAGTLRATPGHRWTAEHVYPDMAQAFVELRALRGRPLQPRLIIVTSSGDVPLDHPAVLGGATIVTGSAGAKKLRGHLPELSDVVEVGDGGPVEMADVIGAMQERGHEIILTEGGPHVLGDLIAAGLLDEVFITVSPVIAGRDRESRHGMVAGIELLPTRGLWSRLLSARRHGDFLFLRYGLTAG